MTDLPNPLETPDVIVRAARAADTDRIVEMVDKLAAHHGDASGLTAEILRRDAFRTPPWLHLLVAEVQGAPAGFAALYGVAQLQFGARGMELHHLFVEDGYRGLGLGVALVEASADKARALLCRSLSVGTHPDNLKAQAFYLSLGFERRDSFPPRFRLMLED